MFPSTACLLQHKIGAHAARGASTSAPPAPAFTYALTTAAQMVASGAHEHALVVGADVMSSIIDYTDRTTCVLFGDGAGAVVLSPAAGRRARHHRLRARDRRQRRPGAVHAGRRQPAAGVARDRRPAAALREAGRRRRCSSSRCARPRRSAGACSSATASTADDLDLFVSHQANRRIIQSAAERLGARPEKVVINIERFGNTTAATIPLALDDAVARRPAEEGRPRAAGVGRRRLHRRARCCCAGRSEDGKRFRVPGSGFQVGFRGSVVPGFRLGSGLSSEFQVPARL